MEETTINHVPFRLTPKSDKTLDTLDSDAGIKHFTIGGFGACGTTF